LKICESKYLTSEVLEADGLPVPRYALITGEENLDQALEAVGGKFPVVLKLLSGTQGIGVSYCGFIRFSKVCLSDDSKTCSRE